MHLHWFTLGWGNQRPFWDRSNLAKNVGNTTAHGLELPELSWFWKPKTNGLASTNPSLPALGAFQSASVLYRRKRTVNFKGIFREYAVILLTGFVACGSACSDGMVEITSDTGRSVRLRKMNSDGFWEVIRWAGNSFLRLDINKTMTFWGDATEATNPIACFLIRMSQEAEPDNL